MARQLASVTNSVLKPIPASRIEGKPV